MRHSSSFIRWSAIAAIVGGLLWVPYGIFEMLEPWGTDTVYREDVGYSVITDTPLFLAYSMPGSLALLLTSLGLLGALAPLELPAGRLGALARILTYVAVVLALLSLGGVIALFDPVFTACRIFGTLALGGAAFLAGADAWRARRMSLWAIALLVLGLTGMFLFPLWPLVYAVQWLPEGGGAAVIGLFGLAWTAFGWVLRSGRAAAPTPPAPGT